jgi:hypothetical protein
MIELFANIPEETKKQAEAITNFIIYKLPPRSGILFLKNYLATCVNEEERQFTEFYFDMTLEHLLNEYNND